MHMSIYATARTLALRALSCLTLCVMMLSGQAFAQSGFLDHNDFEFQVRQFFNPVSFSNSVDNATIWGAAGSLWTLEADDSVPEDIAKYLGRFHWRGSNLFFETKFCNSDTERPRPLSLIGHIDFSQSNRYSNNILPQRVMMSTRNGAASASLKGKCIPIAEMSDMLNGRVTFKADMRRGDEVTINVFGSYKEGSNAGAIHRLVYKPDDSFEALSRNQWKIRPDNNAPPCGSLGFSASGNGTASCCNGMGFNVEPVGDHWFPGNKGFSQTLVGCMGDLRDADALMQTAISRGLKMNSDGTLIAGVQSEAPYIFDPITGLENAEGEWTLTGLELRSFDSRIFAMPSVKKVHDEQAIRDLGVKLTFSLSALEMQAGCNKLKMNIDKIKPGFIRMEDKAHHVDDFCDAKEVISGVLTRKLISIIGGPVLKIDFDEHAQTLTLTRATIGARSRSQSWIFSR